MLDVSEGRLDVDISPTEIERRHALIDPPQPKYTRGYGALYLRHVLQADKGCDFDFLLNRDSEVNSTEPYGLLSGWVGGW